MKKLLLISFLVLINTTTFAQIRALDMALHMGGPGIDQVYSIEIDANGNIYTVGYFEDTVDFDPGTGVHNLISKGASDIFIQKLDESGNLIWVESFGSVGWDRAWNIDIDIKGNIYTTGYFEDTVDFDSGMGTHKLISDGSTDVFIQKLNPQGNFVWAKSFGAGGLDGATFIESDINSNIILSGIFNNTVDFDPDTSVYNLSSNGSQDIFIQKLDSNGNLLWATGMGSSKRDEGRSISLDSHGNIYTVGYYYGSGVDFDPGVGFVSLTHRGVLDVFIQKLDPNGNLLWVKDIYGINYERAYSVVVDAESNVYTTGFYNYTVDFDPDSNATFNMTSSGSADAFIQKLDSSGNFLWAKSIGGSGDDQGFALAVDDSNNVYISGYFEGTVNFNTDSSGVYNLTSNGAQDIFIQKMDENGKFIWAESFGGAGWDQTRSMQVDENGSIFATGYFEVTVDFDPDTNNTFNLSSNGGNDHFILKLNQCLNSFDTLSVTSCFNYTSPSGKIWAQSGSYLDTIGNSTGCDSMLSINLTVIDIDTSLTIVNHVKITANDTLASYQWIECTNGPISGDTNQSFIATANGAYAVILTNNGCVDTSACVSILTVGVREFNAENKQLSFSPNPSNGLFTLEVESELIYKDFQIVDASGRIVKEVKVSSIRTIVDLSEFGKGIYIFQMNEEGIRKKLVVY